MSRYVPPHLRNREQQKPTSSSPSTAQDTHNSITNTNGTRRSLRNLNFSPPKPPSQPRLNRDPTPTLTPKDSPVRSNWSGQDARFSSSVAGAKEDGDGDGGKVEKAKHADLESKETLMIQEFYSSNSRVYENWTTTRGEAHDNEHIARFFQKKKANSNRETRPGAHVGAGIARIFEQFYRYAIDIDNGLAYTQRAYEVAETQGSFWFLDFGFAPGGMAELLLNTHPNIHGVGVSLDPSENGNVYLEDLNSHPRFHVLLADVIKLSRDKVNVAEKAGLPKDFPGFDLCIIGITIHQDNVEGDNMNQLKDLLHFAQLYLSLKVIKPGAMAMMRMHMSSRLVDCHLLAFMLSLFNLEAYPFAEAGRNILAAKKAARQGQGQGQGQKRSEAVSTEGNDANKPKLSKLDLLCKKLESKRLVSDTDSDIREHIDERTPWWNIKRTAIATKPFSTFSMRKSYWVLYHGFNGTEEEKNAALERLQKMIQPYMFAYGYDEEKLQYNLPITMAEPLEEVLKLHGKHMITVLEDVWEKQIVALRGFMSGRTDKECRRGRGCRRRDCNMAHSKAELIPEVLKALDAVTLRSDLRFKAARYDR